MEYWRPSPLRGPTRCRRSILDARPANRLLRKPPKVYLLTSEGISRIELEVGDPSQPCFVSEESAGGEGDIKDAFPNQLIPKWFSKLFGMPAVYAREVGMSQKFLEGRALKAE